MSIHVENVTSCSAKGAALINAIPVSKSFATTTVPLSTLANCARQATVEIVLPLFVVLGVVFHAVRSADTAVVAAPCATRNLPREQRRVAKKGRDVVCALSTSIDCFSSLLGAIDE